MTEPTTNTNVHLFDFVAQEATLRASVFMIGITNAIQQFCFQTTRFVQLTTSGIIDFSACDLTYAAHSFSCAFLQAIYYLGLAIIGLFNPKFAQEKFQDPFLRYNPQEKKFCAPTKAKILCAVNGITFFPCNIVLGVNTLISSPFHEKHFERLEASKIFFCKAFVDLIAIPGGFFLEELRNSECIYTVNKDRPVTCLYQTTY